MWLACVCTCALVFVLICVYMYACSCANFVCGIHECICVYVSVQCLSIKYVFVCVLMYVCLCGKWGLVLVCGLWILDMCQGLSGLGYRILTQPRALSCFLSSSTCAGPQSTTAWVLRLQRLESEREMLQDSSLRPLLLGLRILSFCVLITLSLCVCLAHTFYSFKNPP